MARLEWIRDKPDKTYDNLATFGVMWPPQHDYKSSSQTYFMMALGTMRTDSTSSDPKLGAESGGTPYNWIMMESSSTTEKWSLSAMWGGAGGDAIDGFAMILEYA